MKAKPDFGKLKSELKVVGDKVTNQPKPKRKKKLAYDPNNDPFLCRTAPQRMEDAKKLVMPKKLLGDLLYQNDSLV